MRQQLVMCSAVVMGLAATPWPAMAQMKTARVCADEYAAKKARIEARGLTKKDFIAGCLLETMSQPAAAPAPAAEAPAQAAPVAEAAAPAAPPASAAPGTSVLVTYVGAAGSGLAFTELARFAGRDACLKAAGDVDAALKTGEALAKIGCFPASAMEPASLGARTP